MEKLDIIDKDGNLVNKVVARNLVHAKGMFHHASGLIIISGGGTSIKF